MAEVNEPSTFKDSLVEETLDRSLSASVTFLVVSLVVYFTNIFSERMHTAFFVLFVVLLPIMNVLRIVSFKLWKKQKLQGKLFLKLFFLSATLNGLFWGIAAALGVYYEDKSLLNTVIFVLIVIAFGNASIFTLSLISRLHVAFLICINLPLFMTMYYMYSQNGNSFYSAVPSIMIFLVLYGFAQGRIYKKRMLDKLAADRALFESQKSLLEQQAMTEHANRLSSLGEITAGVAHEINNPLAILSGFLEVVKEEATEISEDGKMALDKAFSNAKRIARIVKSMQQLSSQGSGDIVSNVLMSQVVADATVIFSEKFEQNQIKYHLDVQADPAITGDPVQLTQLVINLVSNGIEAAQKHQGERWLKIRISQSSSHLILAVWNSGPKISADIKDKVFEPFFTTKPVVQGSGLGLSISRTIAKKHGGELVLNYEQEQTCFELRLPLVS